MKRPYPAGIIQAFAMVMSVVAHIPSIGSCPRKWVGPIFLPVNSPTTSFISRPPSSVWSRCFCWRQGIQLSHLPPLLGIVDSICYDCQNALSFAYACYTVLHLPLACQWGPSPSSVSRCRPSCWKTHLHFIHQLCYPLLLSPWQYPMHLQYFLRNSPIIYSFLL